MRRLLFAALTGISVAAGGQEPPARAPDIALPGVSGRIDHFSFDPARRRLLVSALGNGTLEAVDLAAGRREKSVKGFGEPQGVLYVPGIDRIFVANATGNRVDMLDGSTLQRIKSVANLADADNLRYDPASGMVYVGYGAGALRVLQAASGDSAGDIALSGHPESFQLESDGPRIFVNVPDARQIAVVDRLRRTVVATWPLAGASANFPMALDESGRRLFVATRRPALLVVYDIDRGREVARQPIGADSDDLFFDSAHKRIYVICGAGQIDVLRQQDADHYSPEGSITTAPRARTGLFVPAERSLYVAAPAAAGTPARLLVYRLQ